MRDFDLDDILNEFQGGAPEETPAAEKEAAPAREPEEAPVYRRERAEEPAPRYSRRQQTEPNPAISVRLAAETRVLSPVSHQAIDVHVRYDQLWLHREALRDIQDRAVLAVTLCLNVNFQ